MICGRTSLASLVKGRGTAAGGGGILYENPKGIPQSAPLTAPFDKGASCDIRTYLVSTPSTGSFSRFVKNFTTTPVNSAEMTVPSRAPTILKSKNMSDNIIELTTQKTSNAIFTFPNSLCAVSATAFTNASPEFIITFAITASAIPKPSITTPIITMASLTA